MHFFIIGSSPALVFRCLHFWNIKNHLLIPEIAHSKGPGFIKLPHFRRKYETGDLKSADWSRNETNPQVLLFLGIKFYSEAVECLNKSPRWTALFNIFQSNLRQKEAVWGIISRLYRSTTKHSWDLHDWERVLRILLLLLNCTISTSRWSSLIHNWTKPTIAMHCYTGHFGQ